jgi:hypothetical protein
VYHHSCTCVQDARANLFSSLLIPSNSSQTGKQRSGQLAVQSGSPSGSAICIQDCSSVCNCTHLLKLGCRLTLQTQKHTHTKRDPKPAEEGSNRQAARIHIHTCMNLWTIKRACYEKQECSFTPHHLWCGGLQLWAVADSHGAPSAERSNTRSFRNRKQTSTVTYNPCPFPKTSWNPDVLRTGMQQLLIGLLVCLQFDQCQDGQRVSVKMSNVQMAPFGRHGLRKMLNPTYSWRGVLKQH